MPNENPPVNAFKKGHKKVGGRPPGRRNILTNDLKEALLEAATRVGFVREYALGIPVLVSAVYGRTCQRG